MERTPISNEYQDIIYASAGNELLGEIDVEEKVMGHIRGISDRKRSFSLSLKTMNKTTAIASMLALFLMISVTAYAASEYIQIRNSEGVVKVQHVAPNDSAGVASYDKYAAQIDTLAKPGELIAYLVNNKAGTEGLGPDLQFKYKEQRIGAYSDFLKEIKRTDAPMLPALVSGYAFKYGVINPNHPTTDADKKSSLYKETLRDLTAQANQEKGSSNLFMKAIPWSEPGWISAIYSKDNAFIGISATIMHGGKVFVEQEPENQADKIVVAGTEVIYNKVVKKEVSYDYLNWYNEKQDAYYTLTSYGDKILTKEQLLQLAGELLK
ncbi:hypothetical protein [Paenibacillus odorifer]|uniref:DUF4367 domain-containing protein n=1 Tax=Paenibacillus odorifer TaxID=189426 RepID=A0A1R0YA04_9BACL|nr:hypothetical protein [Paenibacillus odorifer]OMD44193.1 hypothetical protein BSK52_01265 [Paenibacillus odorifer]